MHTCRVQISIAVYIIMQLDQSGLPVHIYNRDLGLLIISNSYYPRNGATWVMLPEGWMLSRGRSPSDNISPRADLLYLLTDLLYLPFWQTHEAFQQDLYRNDCIYPLGKICCIHNITSCATSVMLLLQCLWERV